MTKSVYDIIKKQNGELFAREIRRYDNGIFEIANLPRILKHAGRNPLPLLKFLESLKKVKIEEIETNKSPFELLKEAGYNAFLADTLEKQNQIEPYYEPGEALCTFYDKSRYIRFFIIHCVKEGAETLRRSDFKGIEEREDAYGSSVLSIQILKEGGFISIKNRYNHAVSNSDNTFNSNPDNIIRGLSLALKRYFKVDFSSCEQDIPTGYSWQNGSIYKIHTRGENVEFGSDFYLKNGKCYHVNKDKTLIVDDLIIDLQNKKVFSPFKRKDNLDQLIQDEIDFKTLRISKSQQEKSIYANRKLILKVRDNHLTHLSLPTSTRALEGVFINHEYIEEVEALMSKDIKSDAFISCPNLKKIFLRVVEDVSNTFVVNCSRLECVEMPSLKRLGVSCFQNLDYLQRLIFYSLQEVGGSSLTDMRSLEVFSAPVLKKIGSNVFQKMFSLQSLLLPNLQEAQNGCFNSLGGLKELSLLKLKSVGDFSFVGLKELKTLHLPELEKAGSCCFSNLGSREVLLPSLNEMGDDCCNSNKKLRLFRAPSLVKTGDCFLSNNQRLEGVDLPLLEKFESESFKSCPTLKVIKADNLKQISPYCLLKYLTTISAFYAPKMPERALWACFYSHWNMEKILSSRLNENVLSSVKVNQI